MMKAEGQPSLSVSEDGDSRALEFVDLDLSSSCYRFVVFSIEANKLDLEF